MPLISAMMAAGVVAGLVIAADADGLRDAPIVGSAPAQYLDGTDWQASGGGLKLQARVPGDLISDLHRAKVIAEPFFELNFKNASLWNDNVWTYSKTFAHAAAAAGGEVLLVFDSVKMGANISLNGQLLGYASDQFLRYEFPVGHLLKGNNLLTVSFAKSGPDTNTTGGRFMACTGGWDWGPYSNTYEGNDHTFSKGIVKSVYTVPVETVAVAHVATETFYEGPHPTAPMKDGSHGGFTVRVTATLWAPRDTPSWKVSVQGSWDSAAQATTSLSLVRGENIVSVNLTAGPSDVSLWWPNQMGAQPLYNVSVFAQGGSTAAAVRTLGFRSIALVTVNDTDASVVARGGEGTGSHGMMFRVNGAAVLARGANFIPMDNLEGRYSAVAHQRAVQSAAEANMNMLRVWGGGIFLPEAFYDACDRLGIMVFHDMMYTTTSQTHVPHLADAERREIVHNVRRLSHRPSIVLWSACNECGGAGLYTSFVMTTVASVDASRPIWPSCPSHGFAQGVQSLTGLPNGRPLVDADTFHRLQRKPSGAAGAAGSCSFVAGFDVAQAGGGMKKEASKEACCALCWADDKCTSAVWLPTSSGPECWYKYGGNRVASNKTSIELCVPDGKPLPPRTIETHGPYQHGSGWDAVNKAPVGKGGKPILALFDPNIPIDVTQLALGPGAESTFASEFGCSSFSSFESMSPTLSPEHWSVHGGGAEGHCETPDRTNKFWWDCTGGNAMAERNYPCDSIIITYFGHNYDLSAVGEASFKRQLFLCMLGQALEMKSDIQTRRTKNTMGLLTWQLNEIWPTGGWGSLEYGTPGYPGQVVGGRWRPLHHMMAQSVYTNILATCGKHGQCIVRNDGLEAFRGDITVTAVPLSITRGTSTVIQTSPVNLPAGPGAVAYFTLAGWSEYSDGRFALSVEATDTARGSIVTKDIVLPVPPTNLTLVNATVEFTIEEPSSGGSVPIRCHSDATALYVTFTTLASGRFSENAFLLHNTSAARPHTLFFIPFEGDQEGTEKEGPASGVMDDLRTSLRVEHLGMYLQK